MGAGVSSMNRLRKALVMRAYNLRKPGETLQDFFKKHTYRKDGHLYISLFAVKEALSVNAQWVDELFHNVLGANDNDFVFSEFMEFLDSGKLPMPPSQKPPPIKTSPSRPGSFRRENPPTPPRKTPPRPRETSSASIKRTHSIAIPDFDPLTSTIYPGVVRALKLNTLAPGVHDRALVPSKGSAIALNFKDSYRAPLPAKPLWRKREVVRQERTIQYTTIDAEGVLQELVERELSQTEVLHMECRETGEFAHRESTDYEHYETFNNEVVAETRGNEEYVHLKSLDDEYEYMESNMPQKEQPPPEEDPQLSPNPAAAGDEYDGPEPLVEVPEGEEDPLGLNPENWSYKSQSASERKGYSGEDDEDLSPPLSSASYAGKGAAGGQRGNLWSSFGGGAGGDWIPPPRDHRSGLEGEELLDECPEDMDRDRNRSGNYVPAGKRRPDLFESSSSPCDLRAHDSFGMTGRDQKAAKSNQMDGEDEPRGAKYGGDYEEEEGSPFQFYDKKTPGRSENLKRWGSEDDID